MIVLLDLIFIIIEYRETNEYNFFLLNHNSTTNTEKFKI